MGCVHDAWTTDGVALNASDDFFVTCSIWLSFGENVAGRRLHALQPSLFSYISPRPSLNESFPPAAGAEGPEVPLAVVLPIVAGIGVVVPVLAILMWKFREKEPGMSLRATSRRMILRESASRMNPLPIPSR